MNQPKNTNASSNASADSAEVTTGPSVETATDPSLETVERLLHAALALKEASLVIHRRGLLVEFKTDMLLETLSIWEEQGHRSWQIGAFDDHHCHVDLGAVFEVQLDAEPVPCQGGRLNYTIWFLSEHDCGNPYRPRGLFSVTLNRPYEADGSTRKPLVEQFAALYRREQDCSMLTASAGFLGAMRDYCVDQDLQANST